MDETSLARPVWSSLSSIHKPLTIGSGLARRFDPAISPLGAAADNGDECIAALGRLVAKYGHLVVGQTDPVTCPPGARISAVMEAEQMHLEALAHIAETDHRIEVLGHRDRNEMLALAKLTNPGPFAPGTPRLGDFLGIRSGGRLVAMAGERLKQTGFTEISGVCTHPDFTCRGYARSLCAALAARMLARGEQPYLHVFSSNAVARHLYLRLGFRVRRSIQVTVLDPD